MIVCQFCGNPVSIKVNTCPYCNKPLVFKKETVKPQAKKIKVINLEYGKPYVNEALTRFNNELQLAKKQNISLLKIIHGYGSTGKGGKIKIVLHKKLKVLLANQIVKNVIAGELYSKSTNSATCNQKLVNAYTALAETLHADKYNPGITFVEL